jgi:hypothetical protein
MWNLVVAFISLPFASLKWLFGKLGGAAKPQEPIAGQVQAPVAQQGTPIPVIFGSPTIKAQNVVWYGDTGSVAVKAKAGKKG